MRTNESTGKGAWKNVASFYIVLKFLDPIVQNTKIPKFPPKKLQNMKFCKMLKQKSSYEYLKMPKNYLFICVLIIDNNAEKSRQVLMGDF